MSITSDRNIQIEFNGDFTAKIIVAALANAVASGQVELKTLASGNNTITPPVISGIVITGVTIIPPAGNISLMTLKGVNGDTGVPLHLTDPSSIGLNTTFASLVINAAAQIVGVRFIWS